ncbi:hypothetical protein DXG03_005672, partial [Asterophora parasitica]
MKINICSKSLQDLFSNIDCSFVVPPGVDASDETLIPPTPTPFKPPPPQHTPQIPDNPKQITALKGSSQYNTTFEKEVYFDLIIDVSHSGCLPRMTPGPPQEWPPTLCQKTVEEYTQSLYPLISQY